MKNEIVQTSDVLAHNLSVYVANKPGVLARIAQVFARRGYNIDSLVVSSSVDGQYSRMTITAKGDAESLFQVIGALNKLVDVLRCVDHTGEDVVIKEMAMIKIGVPERDRTGALQIVDHFGAKTVDMTESSMIILVTGGSDKIDAMVALLGKYQVIELVRTGKVVMARGELAT
ncbi:MAG: acetolactate synthase small subunit [Kiritimatiellia bacterium]|nr:acetolactate synthase small subunit [Kiritimatiellia bacterium]